jgi:hypothetical protein
VAAATHQWLDTLAEDLGAADELVEGQQYARTLLPPVPP